MSGPDRPTVAVVGAGFSGLLTALHLLQRPGGPSVRLVERRAAFARGAAYATSEEDHLLNVRASNMSAFPQTPDHFTRWLDASGNGGEGRLFVGRRLYGDYLQALLREAAERASAGRLILEADGAESVRRVGGRWRVRLEMGREFAADAVVLAIGNLPPGPPPGFPTAALDAPAYVADPWSLNPATLPQEGCALLLGTGLTMIDVALRLRRERPGLKLAALSRRGLLPRRHLGEGPAPEAFAPPPGAGVRGLVAVLRARAGRNDWRAVVDGLRPHVQAIWRDWPPQERRRFLRHARPWWDVHRHRLSPQVASRLDHMVGAGALTVAAGRIRGVEPTDDGLAVTWTPRASTVPRTLQAAAVINATGPNGDLDRAADPLLRGLADVGLVRADGCRLGLEVDARGRLVGRDGSAEGSLFGVGPLTRGAVWEITSVPDIRVQAQACAAEVMDALASARAAA